MPPKTDVVESHIPEALGKANSAKERPNFMQIAREFDVPSCSSEELIELSYCLFKGKHEAIYTTRRTN